MTENTNSKFPTEAEVVIVGVGGIVGSMTLKMKRFAHS